MEWIILGLGLVTLFVGMILVKQSNTTLEDCKGVLQEAKKQRMEINKLFSEMVASESSLKN